MPTIEINEKFIQANDVIRLKNGNAILVTPPLDEGYWIYRVRLNQSQAIVVFPKFGLLGCGFAIEKDWNTNLPLACEAQEIYTHIKHNKRYADISDAECLAAIKALQEFVTDHESPASAKPTAGRPITDHE